MSDPVYAYGGTHLRQITVSRKSTPEETRRRVKLVELHQAFLDRVFVKGPAQIAQSRQTGFHNIGITTATSIGSSQMEVRNPEGFLNGIYEGDSQCILTPQDVLPVSIILSFLEHLVQSGCSEDSCKELLRGMIVHGNNTTLVSRRGFLQPFSRSGDQYRAVSTKAAHFITYNQLLQSLTRGSSGERIFTPALEIHTGDMLLSSLRRVPSSPQPSDSYHHTGLFLANNNLVGPAHTISVFTATPWSDERVITLSSFLDRMDAKAIRYGLRGTPEDHDSLIELQVAHFDYTGFYDALVREYGVRKEISRTLLSKIYMED